MPRKRKSEDQPVKVIGTESEAKPVKPKLPARKAPKLTFEAWWMQTQKKYNVPAGWKTAVYKHFKARGFLNNCKFDEGFKDFGFKA